MEEIRGFKKSFSFLSVLYVVAGIALLVWRSVSINVICNIIGAVLIAVGITYAIIYFTKDRLESIMEMDLVIGVICASFGAFILLNPNFVSAVLPLIIGIMLFIGAIVKLQTAFDMKKLQFTRWYLVLIVAAALTACGGVLIANPFTDTSVLLIVVAVSLMADGLSNIVCTLLIGQRMKKQIKNRTVKAEVHTDVIEEREAREMPKASEKKRQLALFQRKK